MTETEKFFAKVAAILIVASGVIWGVVDYVTAPLPCAAGQDEICPSTKWTKVYHELQIKQNELSSIGAMLRSGIPGGYTYDDQTGKFKKIPPPPVTPTTMQPAPAAPPHK